MQILKVMSAAVLFALSGVATADEYSILPVAGSKIVSADGRTLSVDVIDTQYQRGTFIISLVDGSYGSIIGNQVDSGTLPLDLTPVTVPAVSGMADVVAWNVNTGTIGGGGVVLQQSINNGAGNAHAGQGPTTAGAASKLITLLLKYCNAANKQSAMTIAIAGATCAHGGGSLSGASVGVCGVGSNTGRCELPLQQK